MSSIPSEIKKLKEKYKTEAIKIKNTSEIKNDLSIIYGNIVRPINIRDENTLIFHKEYIDKSAYKINLLADWKTNMNPRINKNTSI